MPFADFSQFPYYPALLSGAGEHIGYRHLSDNDKDRLLPIFELSQKSNAANLDAACSDVRTSSANRNFILDLCKEPAPPPYIPRDADGDGDRIAREREIQASYNAGLTSLLNPSDGFSAWRQLAGSFPNAIPMLQYTDAVTEGRQILRQAALFAENSESMAIRVCESTNSAIYSVIAQVISILPSPDRLLTIFDCGQSRVHILRRSEFAINGVTEILDQVDLAEQPLIRSVCLSNSFTSPNHDSLRDYANFDWRLWTGARSAFPFMFGDYGAINRLRRSSTFVPPDSRPSVVLPLDRSWLVYRHPNANDPQGWIDGSASILAHADAHPLPDAWGARLISSAAAGNIDGVSSARFWYGAKVNIHLHRQLRFAPRAFEDFEDAS